MKLHKFIATGGKPKDFKGALDNTVVKGTKEKEYAVPMGAK